VIVSHEGVDIEGESSVDAVATAAKRLHEECQSGAGERIGRSGFTEQAAQVPITPRERKMRENHHQMGEG
jgi:hypothetical protein